MTKIMFTDYIKGYIDNHIDIPDYVNNCIKNCGLDPIKIYHIGCDYLKQGLVKYAEPILKSVGVTLA